MLEDSQKQELRKTHKRNAVFPGYDQQLITLSGDGVQRNNRFHRIQPGNLPEKSRQIKYRSLIHREPGYMGPAESQWNRKGAESKNNPQKYPGYPFHTFTLIVAK